MSPCVEDPRSPCVEARGCKGGFGSPFAVGMRGTSVVLERPRAKTGGFPPDASPEGMAMIFLLGFPGDTGRDESVSSLLVTAAMLLPGTTADSLLLLVPSSRTDSDSATVESLSVSSETVRARDLDEVGGRNSDCMVRSEAENSEYCME